MTLRTAPTLHWVARTLFATLVCASVGLSTPPVHAAANNLILNGGLEDGANGAPTGFSTGEWGTLTAVHTYPVVGVDGSRAAEVSISAYTDGDAKWVHAHVPVVSGHTYVYEDQYRATRQTTLVAEYARADGSLLYVWLGDVAPTASWTPLSKEFIVPDGVVTVSVFHILAGVGTLGIDTVSLVEKTTTPPPPPPSGSGLISITFDDAWKSQYTNALPLLAKYGMKGTFYITTQYFNQSSYTGFMTRANVKDLYAKGHEIGGHTVTHPDLTTVGLAKLRAELKNSKATLDTLLGKPIKGIAYPYGAYNQRVIDETKKMGYTYGRTVEAGLNTPSTDLFKLKSISPSANTPISEVKRAIDDARAQGQWLIITFHEIDTNGREYANTPAYLEEVLAYIQAGNTKVVTVEQGLTLR